MRFSTIGNVVFGKMASDNNLQNHQYGAFRI